MTLTISADSTLNADQLSLKSYMEMISKHQQSNAADRQLKYGGLEDLLLKEGAFDKIHGRGVRYSGEAKGQDKRCFMNAYRLMLSDPNRYTYIEGVAIPDGVPLSMHHAWCVDKHDYVVDPTWRQGVAYYGIHFSTEYVVDVMARAKVYGLLGWESAEYRSILKSGLPAGAKQND